MVFVVVVVVVVALEPEEVIYMLFCPHVTNPFTKGISAQLYSVEVAGLATITNYIHINPL